MLNGGELSLFRYRYANLYLEISVVLVVGLVAIKSTRFL